MGFALESGCRNSGIGTTDDGLTEEGEGVVESMRNPFVCEATDDPCTADPLRASTAETDDADEVDDADEDDDDVAIRACCCCWWSAVVSSERSNSLTRCGRASNSDIASTG